MRKIFKYLQEHPYANGIVTLCAIIGFLWTVCWGVFIYIRPPSTSNSLSKESAEMKSIPESASSTDRATKIFVGSIFDLTKEILKEPITIKKEDLYKKNLGLLVKDSGYVTDIKNIPDNEYPDRNYRIAINMSDSQDDRTASIQCLFTESWRQTILSSNLSGKKIQFNGIIRGEKNYNSVLADDKNLPLLYLADCSILR